jgi:hypothetical protein
MKNKVREKMNTFKKHKQDLLLIVWGATLFMLVVHQDISAVF